TYTLLGGNHGPRTLRLAVAAGTFVAYFSLVFTGFGRLVLVTVALIGAVAYTMRARTRLPKVLLVLLVPPALFGLVALRENTSTGRAAKADDGLGSVTNPLVDAEHLRALGEAGALQFGHGDSFLATALFWVPRSLWPSKPEGFGSV